MTNLFDSYGAGSQETPVDRRDHDTDVRVPSEYSAAWGGPLHDDEGED